MVSLRWVYIQEIKNKLVASITDTRDTFFVILNSSLKKMQTYSSIATNICTLINQSHLDSKELLPLIIKSYEFITTSQSEAAKLVHNKLLNLLILKHYSNENLRISEDYQINGDSIKELESRFTIDPSNYGNVLKLSEKYFLIGKHKRARQLLERVASSEYAVAELAMSTNQKHRELRKNAVN